MTNFMRPSAWLGSLARNPRFSATVIVVLALGIGINVATLGLLYRYYISPLPYPQGGRVMSVYFTANQPIPKAMSIPTWERLKKGAPALANSGLYRNHGYNLVLGSRRSRLNGIEATVSVFSTLAVRPALGRVFGSQSNKPGAQPVAVLSYRLWQRLFDGKVSAIGKTLHLNGKLYTVIGVMPKGFNFPTRQTALWTPYTMTSGAQDADMLTGFHFRMVGRLARGVSMKTFLVQANTVLQREIANFPYPQSIPHFKQIHLAIHAQGWRSSRIGHLQRSLVLVFCATALLMLLVWFNLSNLFLTRSFSRRSELTMRRILGASTGTLVFGLARENFILSLVGAGLGVVFGHFLLGLFAGSTIAVGASAVGSASWPALVVIATILALVSTAVFTLMGVSFLRGNDLSAALGDAGAHASPGRGAKRLRVSLIAGQIALACAIAGTGLLLGRSLLNLNAVHLGFKPDHVITFKLSFPQSQYQYPDTKVIASLDRLRSSLKHSAGIKSVTLASQVPFDSRASGYVVGVNPRPVDPSIHPVVFPTATDAGYFRTLGMPLLAGRNFRPTDRHNGTGVAIIDTLAATRLFGTDKNVVGRKFSFNCTNCTTLGLFFRVIGVVPTVRRANLGSALATGNIYVDFDQVTGKDSHWTWGFLDWYLAVRSPLPTAAVVSEVKGVARRVIPGIPLYDVQTMNQRLAASLASNRLLTVLVLLFAIGALVLAAIGLYAVQAYAVAQRAREFAIRAALGADRSRLLALVLGETVRLLVIGLVIGLAGLAGIGVAFASAFYGIGAVDPTSMAITAVVLVVAALAASWFPAWRASRVAPDKALRNT